jgi:DnaK suppressor protein
MTRDGDIDLDEIERTLRAHKAEIDAKVARLANPPERGSGISFGKRVGDGTSEAIQRLNDIGVGNTLLVQADRVDRALEKLEEGTYGLCDSCGRPILPARLRVQPESVVCIDCARGG